MSNQQWHWINYHFMHSQTRTESHWTTSIFVGCSSFHRHLILVLKSQRRRCWVQDVLFIVIVMLDFETWPQRQSTLQHANATTHTFDVARDCFQSRRHLFAVLHWRRRRNSSWLFWWYVRTLLLLYNPSDLFFTIIFLLFTNRVLSHCAK